MAEYEIDGIDKKILAMLINDARTPYLEIARLCKVSGAAIHQRVRKLEEKGVITGSRLLVQPRAIGLGVCVYINIALSEAAHYKEVVSYLMKVPEIVECHFVTGRYALLVKAYCSDNDDLINVLIKDIQNIPYIQATDTSIVLDTAFDRQVRVKSGSSR